MRREFCVSCGLSTEHRSLGGNPLCRSCAEQMNPEVVTEVLDGLRFLGLYAHKMQRNPPKHWIAGSHIVENILKDLGIEKPLWTIFILVTKGFAATSLREAVATARANMEEMLVAEARRVPTSGRKYRSGDEVRLVRGVSTSEVWWRHVHEDGSLGEARCSSPEGWDRWAQDAVEVP